MLTKYNFGDTVKLKTGNTLMRIKGHPVRTTAEGAILIRDSYICSWYEGKKPKKAIFPESILIKV